MIHKPKGGSCEIPSQQAIAFHAQRHERVYRVPHFTSARGSGMVEAACADPIAKATDERAEAAKAALIIRVLAPFLNRKSIASSC